MYKNRYSMLSGFDKMINRSRYSVWYRAQLLSLILIALTLPFAIGINNIAIGLLVLTWILSGHYKEKLKAAFTNKLCLLFLAVFLIQVIGLFYTSDIKEGLGKIERKAALFILPFVLVGLEKLQLKHVHYIVTAFVVACTVLSIYALSVVFINYDSLHFESGLTEYIDNVIGLHHAYSGMYLVFAVAAALYMAFSKESTWSTKYRIPFFIVSVLLYSFLIILAARTAVFTSFLLLFAAIVYKVIIYKKLKYIVGAALLCAVIGLIVLSLPNTKAKVAEFESLRGVHSPFTPRLIKWRCSFQILEDQKAWMYGVGTGDVQDHLQVCYTEENFWGDQYLLNAHNEFLEEMARHGLPGAFLFIASLVFPFVLSIKYKKWLYTLFLTIFILCSFTESTLSRQKGVVFYALFNSVFAFHYLKNQKQPEVVSIA